MTIKEEMITVTRSLKKSLGRLKKLEERPQHIMQEGINVEIVRGEVHVSCPRGTVIEALCWYNDVTHMTERFEVGTEEHAWIIQTKQDIEARLDALEKQL